MPKFFDCVQFTQILQKNEYEYDVNKIPKIKKPPFGGLKTFILIRIMFP